MQGCAKYGIPGLMCLVQWHETAERPFSAAAGGPYLAGPRTPLERLLRVLLQRVQDRSQLPAKKDSRADNLRLIAIEVRCCINSLLQLFERTWLYAALP